MGMKIKAEVIINDKLTPALNGEEKLNEKHWEEIVLALGEVAAGVAHEIRNPLTGIKGFSQLLQSRFHPQDKEWPYIRNILKEAEKIESLIEELLMLSRPTFPRRKSVKVSFLLDEVLPLLASEAVSRKLKIETHYDEELEIRVDTDQLKIALYQIGKTSIHAMKEGQVLKISTRRNKKEGFSEISFLRPEPSCDETTVSLGAAVVKKIIENHNGVLETVSLKDKGTLINIKIPLKI